MHKSIQKSNLFECKLHISAPNRNQRCEFFLNLLTHTSLKHNLNDVNLDEISCNTDGYSVLDLKNLYNRALQDFTIRSINGSTQSIFGLIDFQTALKSYKPVSLLKARTSESLQSWDEIGGMHKVKKILVETLQWPTIYPQIFSNSPIRLRSGILLYGFPGCGKTVLAGSAAKKFGLNLISIKGPELLSKYIGASEQSVRDLFERAKACRPCLLFLDEFDSIAPKRGQDNTGVTDRVVNQLLTELDGAEGLFGVYVIAGRFWIIFSNLKATYNRSCIAKARKTG